MIGGFGFLRRSLLAASLWGALPFAQAQDTPKPITAVGIFSLLGDKVQITIATEPPAGTHPPTAGRQVLSTEGIAFDGIVLKVANAAFEKTAPGAPVSLYKVTTWPADQQRELAVGADGGALPAWMVQAIESKRLSHILIVTRDRGDASFQIDSSAFVGRGTVEGIGFYIDTMYQLPNVNSTQIQNGLLVPYAEINVQLMDVYTAKVVRSYRVHGGIPLLSEDQTGRDSDPWNFVDVQTKVKVLRDLVDKGMQKAMAEVLKPR